MSRETRTSALVDHTWNKSSNIEWIIWHLTSLHALVVVLQGGWPVVGFVDGGPEALVTAPPPDDARARPVEGEVTVQGDLCYRRLEAL